jgi:hypothetical protein
MCSSTAYLKPMFQLDGQATETGGQTLLQRLIAAGFTHNSTLELIKPKHFEREGVAAAVAISAATM